jgi:hypothetical protein
LLLQVRGSPAAGSRCPRLASISTQRSPKQLNAAAVATPPGDGREESPAVVARLRQRAATAGNVRRIAATSAARPVFTHPTFPA